MIILLLSIDATKSVSMARYVNDSPEAYANCRPKQFVLDGVPHIVLIAKEYIPAGKELRYNYDHKDPRSLSWRSDVKLFDFLHYMIKKMISSFMNGCSK